MPSMTQQTKSATNSPWLERAARTGFAVNGFLNLTYAFICWQIIRGDSSGATQSGALRQLAGGGAFGMALLWAGLLSCVALSLWQLSNAVFDHAGGGWRAQLKHRGTAAGRGLVYAAIAVALGQFVFGTSQHSGGTSQSLTATLMSSTAGSALLIAIGLGILAVAAYSIHKGVKRKFLDDLRTTGPHPIGRVTRALGVAGYVARGAALAALGLLVIVATVSSNPESSTGLDAALRALAEQPFGLYLLIGIGLGLFAYGLYSFARVKFAKM